MKFASSLLIAAAALGLCAPPAAAAQQSEDAKRSSVNLRTEGVGEPIVVVGDLELEEDRVRDAVRDIAMRGRSFDEPLMKYQDPLCVTVAGFGAVLGPRIEERIRMQARVVGAKVAEPGCAPNATVIMVDRPKVLIERMRQQRRDLFSPGALRQIDTALNRGDPAIHWFVAERRNLYGDAMENFAGVGGLGAPGIAGELLFQRDARFASRIEVPFSIARTGSVVVFDAYKLDNVHLDQVADYAVMRILGHPQPQAALAEDQPDTILNLFRMDPLEASHGLTLMDLAYLRGLYAMKPNESSTRLENFTIAAYRDLVELGCEEAGNCETEREPG
ncbi:hypothetical protein Ga0102493_112026 [Erythrobacter litoralis]|jgi:hypothetical protein|uniref:DUF2927 domain-containing protein n=1 Tax=Erythrobacter litoralis TaxID=39960 RepID=A0A074MHZ3_9SPHN|nr:hypothetical protein [Erythrobacter litoralis]AOL23045.1 hypothetical protein Ga0102493_112026 [Erythrobacter litoralis]KEO93089.1 hypothetical protein EH32_12750 [Erythrobacter litoralis]MEE4339508.1 hypothetical protein [Erythrobacter sp.]